MEKRLFYRDPCTGIETPLLPYLVDTNAVSRLQVEKQDNSTNLLYTTDKTIVGAINEVNASCGSKLVKPSVDGSTGQVLSAIDSSGNYSWKTPAGVKDVSLEYDEDNQALYIRIIPF